MWRYLKNIAHLFEAIVANILYGFPSKRVKVLAITGTDGKTTTSTLLYHILNSSGKKVALISTVAAFIGDSEIDTGFHVTNPSPFALQRLLRRTIKEGMEYVVLEVTSHGIDQHRNWGITPTLAGITNVTHEHLDYHKTYDAYVATKARLLLGAKHAFINKNATMSYDKLHSTIKQAGVVFTIVDTDELSSSLVKATRKRFGEEQYNFENVALASAMARQIGIDDKVIAKALITFTGVKGRMESIPNDRGMTIIVDFAHTPNALERALESMRGKMKKEKNSGKLIVLFGCASERDVNKRPVMGEIAVRLADYAIFTAEDPRREDIWSIINQMKSGVRSGHNKIVSVADRFEAIQFAITTLAKKGDTILITGKGHEQSMNIGGVEYNWNDEAAVRKVLAGETKF